MVFDAKLGRVEVLCGQGVAPALATRDFFQQRGGIPGEGLLPATVPGVVDACVTLLTRHGTRTFAQVSAPTLVLLDRHAKPWHEDLAITLRRLIEAETRTGGDRARGLQDVADYFYRGPIAAELAAWCEVNGGLIRASDLADHVTRVEEPLSVDYRGHTVYKCDTWTQGAYALQTLRLLEGFDLKSLGHSSPRAMHLTAEAMKLALADRDVFYGDRRFVDVPLAELLSPSYAALRRSLIDPQHASLKQQPGDPRHQAGPIGRGRRPGRPRQQGQRHDDVPCGRCGRNVIAATPSGWDGVLAGSTGVWLGSRLQSFNLWPGHPNCIEPGKRPRTTLTPTLVLKQGRPTLAISVAGGDRQDQTAIQLLINAIDFGLSPAESVTALRFGTDHHVGSFLQTPPQLGDLRLYDTAPKSLIEELTRLGHKVRVVRAPIAAPCVLAIDPNTQQLQAAGDPLARRSAAAW